LGVDVLQAHLTAGHQLVVLGAADLDLPELLRPSLLDRDRDDLKPAGAVRPHKVGGIQDADCMLGAVLDRLERARRRERLDDSRVEPAVDDSPRLMVALVGGDRAAHARRGDLVEPDVEQFHQLASLSRGHRARLFQAGVKFWWMSLSA
jgi:hypothetical protein